jgi:hypothetical protein
MGSNANISQLDAPTRHYYILHFKVFEKCEINHGCWLCCTSCIYKISSQNIIMFGMCQKKYLSK